MSHVQITRLTKTYPGIKEAPFLLIQSHGGYDLKKYKEGSVEFEVIVPENTLVIETGKAGDVCELLNTTEDLITFFTKRDTFLNYIVGSHDRSDSADQRQKTLDALSICTIYSPGDKIINRVLSIDAGRGIRRTPYDTLGFLQMDTDKAGVATTKLIFPEIQRELEGMEPPNFTTYQRFFSIAEKAVPGAFRIFFFLSCGSIDHYETPEDNKYISMIKKVQNDARTRWVAQFKARNNSRYLRRTLHSNNYKPPNEAGAGGAGGAGGASAAAGGTGGGKRRRVTRKKRRYSRRLV